MTGPWPLSGSVRAHRDRGSVSGFSEKEHSPQSLWEMWKSRAVFSRDFSKRLWKSTFFPDFHNRVIFHQAGSLSLFLPTNSAEDPFLLGKLLGALVFVLVYEALVLFTGYLLSVRSSASTLSLRVLIQALIANAFVVIVVEAFTALMAVLFVNSYAAGGAAVFYFYVLPASYSRLIQLEALAPFRNHGFWLEYLYPFGSEFERLLEGLSASWCGHWDLVYVTGRFAIYASFFVWLSLRVFRRKNLF